MKINGITCWRCLNACSSLSCKAPVRMEDVRGGKRSSSYMGMKMDEGGERNCFNSYRCYFEATQCVCRLSFVWIFFVDKSHLHGHQANLKITVDVSKEPVILNLVISGEHPGIFYPPAFVVLGPAFAVYRKIVNVCSLLLLFVCLNVLLHFYKSVELYRVSSFYCFSLCCQTVAFYLNSKIHYAGCSYWNNRPSTCEWNAI